MKSARSRYILRHSGRTSRIVRLLKRVGVGLFLVLASFTLFSYTRAGGDARVYAAANRELNFQARLLNGSGAIAPDGTTYTVEFNLYNVATGGTTQWTETLTNVTVRAGYLSVHLGNVTPFPSTIDWSQQQWLTMNVNGDGEMNPRLQLTAVPLALRSVQADGITNGSSTLTANDLTQLAPSSVQAVNAAVAALRLNQQGSGLLAQLQGNGTDVFTIAKNGDITSAGSASFDGNATVKGGTLTVGTSSQAGSAVIQDGSGHSLTLQSGTQTGNLTFTLPTSHGNNLDCLKTNGSGVLSFGGCATSGAYTNGGNSFGAAATLGTQDNYSLALITGGTQRMLIDTSGNITIGAVDSSASLFVVDTKNTTGDPAGTNGAIYYNSFTNKFRCYENGAWNDCISGASGNTSANFVSGLQNVPANASGAPVETLIFTSATGVSNTAGVTGFTAPADGSFRTCLVKNNAAITAGTLSVRWQVNGASVGSAICNMDATTNRQVSDVLNPGVVTFHAGDTIGIAFDTSAGFLPAATNDFTVYWGVDYSGATGGGGANFDLQDAYDNSINASILTANNKDITVSLADTTTDSNFVIDIQSGSTGEFKVQNNGTDVLRVNKNGDIAASGGLTIGNTSSSVAGTIRWTGLDFEGFDGSIWHSLTSGTGGGGGGISSNYVNIVKQVNETVNNSATLQNDDELAFNIGANEEWTYRFVVQANSGTTPDLRFAVTAPSGAVCFMAFSDVEGASSASQTGCGVSTVSVPGNGTADLYEVTGSVKNGSTAGTVNLQWAQFTANASNSIVYAGSYLSAYRTIGSGGAGQPFVQGGNGFGGLATLGTTDTNALSIITSGTERMHINATGEIGIGTSGTPSALLSIGGTTGNLTVDTSGNLATIGTINTNTFSSTALTFGGAGAATIQAANNQNLTVQTQGSGSLTLASGSGIISLGTNTTLRSTTGLTVDLNNNSSDQILTLNNSGTNAAFLNLQDGGLQVGGSTVLSNGRALSNLTGISTTGSLVFNSFSGSAGLLGVDGSGNVSVTATNSFEVPLTFNNGLTRTGNTITLGGNLIAATDIGLNGNALTITGSGGVNTFASTGALTLGASGTGLSITNNATVGGTLAVNGNALSSSSSAFTLLSAPTNVTAFGAATTLSIGTSSGTTTINGNTLTNTAFTFAGASASSVQAANNQNLTIQTQGSGVLGLNTGSGGIITTNAATVQKSGSALSIDVANGGSNSTLTITNSGAGVANLSVEGTLSAANGEFNVDSVGNLTGSASATGTSSTTTNTSGIGGTSTSTSVNVVSSAAFTIGHYIQMNSTNCNSGSAPSICYAKITNIVGNTLTITPALHWGSGATVNDYVFAEIGGNGAVSPTLTSRYGRGYFIAGVVTGNGTTYYNEDGINTSQDLFEIQTSATNGVINIGTASNTGTISIGNTSGSTTIVGSVTFTGNVTAPTTGTSGYLQRSGTTLSPSNSGDSFTTSGNITTSSTGTITSAAGITVQAGGLNLTSSGITNAGSITGVAGLTLSSGNLALGGGNITGGGSIAGTSLSVSGSVTAATTGTINGLNINSGAVSGATSISASGSITAATTGTINGLNISSGAVSGVTGLTFTSGALNLNSGGITNAGSIAGATSITVSGSITAATSATINGLSINAGALSDISTISASGGITAATSGTINGLSINAGALSGISTISASGAITAATTGTINGLNISSGTISGVTGLTFTSGNLALGGGNISGVGTIGSGAITSTGLVTGNGLAAGSGGITGSGGISLTGSSTINGTAIAANALTFAAGNSQITTQSNGDLSLTPNGSGVLGLNTGSGGTATTNISTLQRTGTTGLTIDLKDSAATSLTLLNSGTGTPKANLSLSGGITASTTTNTINGLIVNSGALSNISTISASGSITAATSGTINGLNINAGALSGVAGLTFTSGALNLNSGGITNTGSIAGATTISASGAITAATATNTINGLVINGGALSSVTSITASGTITANTTGTINGLNINSGVVSGIAGLTFTSGALNLNNGGITNTGSIAGATTITASGAITATTSGTINGLSINSGALSGISTISASGAITAATATNTINGLVINSGSLTNVGANITASASLTVASGGSGDLGFNSASNIITIDSTDTTLRRATSGNFSLELNGGASASAFVINNTGAGAASLVLTDGDLSTGSTPTVRLTNAGALQNITTLSLSGSITGATSGTINGLSINAGALSGITTISASGAITAATATNTINGLVINAGALSSVTSITASGTITANTTGTINGLNINSGAISGITGLTFTSGALNLNNGGITNTGSIAGATTISASGAISAATATNTINGLIINSGALTSVTGITFTSGNLALGGGNITGVGTNITASAGLTIASGGAGALVLDSASNSLTIAASDTQFQRTASGTFIFELTDAGTTTFQIKNSGTGVANLDLFGGGLSTASTIRLTNAGALQNITTIGASGLATLSGGATISGAIINLNASSNFAVNIGTGTSTGAVSIGGGNNAFALSSTTIDISAGAVSGVTTLTASGNITTSGIYRQGALNGSTVAACTASQYIGNGVRVSGGIITAGTCRNDGLASDIRLKKDITDIGSVLDRVQALHIVSYNYKVDEMPELNLDHGLQYGVIAQELEQLFPELVTTGTNGYKEINFKALSFYNMKAVGELANKVDSLSNATSSNELKTGGVLRLDSNGALVNISGLTMSGGGASVAGGLNNNNGGITNAGAISGATTITAESITLTANTTNNLLDLRKDDKGVFTVFNNGALQIRLDADNAFSVKKSDGSDMFTINSNGGLIQIGGATGDANAVLLVLDSKNTEGDPAGVNGAQYYNSATNSFRCYQNGHWQDCLSAAFTEYVITTQQQSWMQPNTEREFPGNPRSFIDLSNAKQFRMVATVNHTGNSATECRLQYALNDNGPWTNLSTDAEAATLPITSSGTLKSGWLAIDPNGRHDVVIRIMCAGTNNVTTNIVSAVRVQIK